LTGVVSFHATEGPLTQEPAPIDRTQGGPSPLQRIVRLGKRPRILLLLLAAWSVLAALTQVFVNSGLFLDVHDIELDGAMGGFALSFQALPLALLYLYCWRDPRHYHSVFWFALLQQVAICAGVLYQWAIGTFSLESIVLPLVGSAVLAVFSFLQIFEPKKAPG
jgi:hypothetical protein